MARYRPVTRIREGWQISMPGTASEPRANPWPVVVKVLHVQSPLSFVRLDLEGGDFVALNTDEQVFCRTPAEAGKESKVMSAALVPLGSCGGCGEPVPGYTDRRYMLCKVKAGWHWHPRLHGLVCIGSHKLARPFQAVTT